MLKAGVKFTLFLADYHGFINNKFGGDLEKIQTAGKYFIEVWKACGVDIKKVKIIWASDILNDRNYWKKVLDVGKKISLARTKRAITIMGRQQGETISLAQLFYPPMQVADIFHLGIDICQLGMDQRRAHVIARDLAPKLGFKKPVAIHHHILLGLQGAKKKIANEGDLISAKMSKSNPKTCIYMHNTFDEIKKKLASAYCPAKIAEGNPVLEYNKHIIFKEFKTVKIERAKQYGGNLSYTTYVSLERDFTTGKLHPADLKLATAIYLEKLIKPVREHFEKNKRAAKLYAAVKNATITR
jgi:tyrosyl-tRNA synthetase